MFRHDMHSPRHHREYIMSAKIAQQEFAAAVERLFEQKETPLRRLHDKRGVVYALPDGKTVRLRTNNKPTVIQMETANGEFSMEQEDLLAIAFPIKGKIQV